MSAGLNTQEYPVTTVAGLASLVNVQTGSLAYATDARVGSQTAGNGTGSVVSYNGTAWELVGTDTTAVA